MLPLASASTLSIPLLSCDIVVSIVGKGNNKSGHSLPGRAAYSNFSAKKLA
jgi:hypothetical protein